MIGRTISLVIVACLLLGTLLPFIDSNKDIPQSASTSILGSNLVSAEEPAKVHVLVSSKGTFFRADPFIEDRPEGGSIVEMPSILNLDENGIFGNMWVKITFEGQICYDLSQDPPQYYDITNLPEVGEAGVLAVFSTTDDLRSASELYRVPGAIDYGSDYITGPTYFDEQSTDIIQDFALLQNMEIQVPLGSKYLFICTNDCYYPDNLGVIQVSIDKDTDGDSLFDSWEYFGIDFNYDGMLDLNLSMLGASWKHKDIFVEADYLKDRAPNQDAINDVKAAFRNAQVTNPDKVKGINLHVLINEKVGEQELIGFGEFYALKNHYFGTLEERANLNMLQAKKMVYRYCLFANKLSINVKCPGIAEGITCDDFILAFGAFRDGVGSREYQAAVFMHELGHTLGLGHGGRYSNVNYKPNYPSIMNYAYQYADMLPSRPLDYSYGRCRDLKELSLEEKKGIGQAIGLLWMGTNNTIYRDDDGSSVDWDDNGWIDSDPVKINVNNRSDCPSLLGDTLRDSDDWNNLVYKFRGTPLSAASATPEDYHIELTTDQIEQMKNDAVNIIDLDTSASEDSEAGLPMEAVLAIVAVAAIVIVVAVLFFMRKKK